MRCPGALCQAWASELVLYARLAQEHGAFVDGRPLLEQTNWMIEASMFVWSVYAKSLEKDRKG